MRTRHIEVFNNIYKTGSVTAAAKLLNVSQPSVSKVLAHAEQQLGFALFERIKMKLIPTPEANILYKHTSVMEDVLIDIKQISESLTGFPLGSIRVACTPSLGVDFLPQAIAKFKKNHPEIAFEISTLQTSDLRNKIRDTSIDIAIAQDQSEDEEIGLLNISEGKFVLLKPKGQTLKSSKTLPFIKLSSKSPLGKKLETYLENKKLITKSTITSDNYQMAAALVNNGFGYTILDEFTALTCRNQKSEILPLIPPLEFKVDLLFLKNKPFAIALRKFLEFLPQFNYQL